MQKQGDEVIRIFFLFYFYRRYQWNKTPFQFKNSPKSLHMNAIRRIWQSHHLIPSVKCVKLLKIWPYFIQIIRLHTLCGRFTFLSAMPNVVISYSPFFCGTFYRGAHHQKSSKDFLLLNCFWHFCFAYISHAIAFQKAKLDKFHMAVCVCLCMVMMMKSHFD